MKFTVNKKELYSKLQYAIKIISNKNSLPILDCFLLGIKGTILQIAATDGEIRINTKVDISNVEGEGRICVDAAKLTNALKELPDQPLSFDINDDTKEVLIKYHNGKYNFIGENADDYPQPKQLDDKVRQIFKIEAHTLEAAINSTIVAVSNDELRPSMTGILFDLTKDNLTFVASDGHKLIRLISLETKGADSSSFILPSKGANLLKSVLPKQSDTVTVRFDFNQAVFDLTDYMITIRFVEGRYPNYNSVIPKSNPIQITMSRDALLAIIKRISVFGNKQSGLIKLDLEPNKLIASAQDIDYSLAATEQTEIEYAGTPMSIGFKAAFLIELLSIIQSDEVEIHLSDASKAALIVPVQNVAGFELTNLLMPMLID